MKPILEVKLISELKNIIEITIKEDATISPSEHSYIIRQYSSVYEAGNVYQLNQMNYQLNIIDNMYVYQFLIEAETTGITCGFAVTRINTTTFDVEVTDTVEVTLAPSQVKGVVFNQDESIYDQYLEIPKVIKLEWQPYDTTNNNLDVVGFNIYYALSESKSNNWGRPEKLRGNSTGDKESAITLIDKNETSFIFKVPQLTDIESPKDMKLYVVAVASDKQSELSSEILINTKEFVAAYYKRDSTTDLIYSSKENTDNQLTTLGVIVRPHYSIHLTENAFLDDCFVWCERETSPDDIDGADPYEPALAKILGWDYKYYYTLRVDELNVPTKMTLYYPTKKMMRMDIRLNYGNGYVSVPYTYNINTSLISFSITGSCKILFLVKEAVANAVQTTTFSNATKRIIEKLPTWSKIRKSPTKSNGAYFLELMGMEFEELDEILEYAKEQLFIPTSDMSQLSTIYKINLPEEFKNTNSIVLEADGRILEEALSLEDFKKSCFTKTDYPEIYYNDLYMIDYEERVVYTRKYYNSINLHIYENGDKWYEQLNINEEPYKVWNFLDEFGLLMDIERFAWESNADFKERLLDVFKNPSNASRDGLLNGIARELSQRVIKVWSDTKMDFIIKDKMIPYNKIQLNGEYIPSDKIYFTDEGYILIKADDSIPANSEISYVTGIELRTLHNRDDIAFYKLLYNQNGTATPLLKKYADIIKSHVPIEWGKFHWNIGYWDTSGEEYGGVSFIPNILDARIDGFYE